MAILTLGLFGEKAQQCVPILAKLYQNADPTTRQVIRMVIKRIKPSEAQSVSGRTPEKTDDEDPWWNGTKP